MKNYTKNIAGIVLSATMAMSSSSHADVTIGELQNFVGPLESMIVR